MERLLPFLTHFLSLSLYVSRIDRSIPNMCISIGRKAGHHFRGQNFASEVTGLGHVGLGGKLDRQAHCHCD